MAAIVENLKELQSEITCSICKAYFCEPVTIGCGHNFCKACLSSSWRIGAPAFSCPECRQVSQDRKIPLVNRCLAELTELGKELSSKILQSTEGQSQCVTHKKLFKLFCEDDQTALCVTCCETPEHGAHKISPMQEAVDNYRRELEHIRSRVEKHLEEDEQLLAQEERAVTDWHWMMRGEFSKLHHLLMEEEFQRLERFQQAQKTSQDRLSQYLETLQELKLELQKEGHQANQDLLQDGNQLLERCEAVLSRRAKAITPELREYPLPGLIEMLNRYRVDLTIDLISADSSVTVSEDLKSAKAGEGWQVKTKFPDDFPHHYVFAEQAFSSGSQYWEVDVTQLPQWILGIYTPHVHRRRGRNVNSGSPVFLLRCIKKEEDYYLQTYPGLLNHRVKGPMPRIGVFLVHAPGTLSFYNILQHSLIYKFYPILFRKPVIPVFSPGPPLAGTNPGPMNLCLANSHLCACCHSCV
ncbi:tripartite motif-containing protein 43-like [Sarcophilus harrisii]|uniref:Uncharacterized protein n=1 Tax=Sarcophilus harrisii TaxID=9305 RepID=A0A7N4NT57_SARHA|nr:tripartite motif-containing protein 43-like [Sarcophilus harrisii]XP_031796239.1 tripartite motif-containing protein 43-like [Sarcophilus harrisii]